MTLKEYQPGTAFPGVIGLTTDQSSPAWPAPLRANLLGSSLALTERPTAGG